MSLILYLLYIVTAFSLYMVWLVGVAMFIEMVVPWLIFMAVIFAPLLWVFRNKDIK